MPKNQAPSDRKAILIEMPDGLKETATEMAERIYMNRSEFIREAVRRFIHDIKRGMYHYAPTRPYVNIPTTNVDKEQPVTFVRLPNCPTDSYFLQPDTKTKSRKQNKVNRLGQVGDESEEG